jgi:hypothetical protein
MEGNSSDLTGALSRNLPEGNERNDEKLRSVKVLPTGTPGTFLIHFYLHDKEVYNTSNNNGAGST